MDWQAIWDWIWAERTWLFSGLVFALISGLYVLFRKSPRSDQTAETIVEKLLEKERESVEKDSQIKALEGAVEALSEQEGPGIQDALKELEAGRTEAAEAIFQQILDHKKGEGEAAFKEAATAARHLGALAYLHDTEKALAAYRQAVELDPDDPDGWNMLGHLLLRTGKLDEAVRAYEKVLALGNRTGDKGVIAVATGNLGLIALTRGDLDKAEEFHRKSLALHEELGSKEGMANQYGNLGLIARTRGDLDGAEEFHRKSLALDEELGSKEGMAADYGNLGLIARTRGDLDKAEEFHRKSLALHEELGRKEGMAANYGNLGNIAQIRGDLDGAEEFHRKSLALHEELGSKEGMANQYGNLGGLYNQRGDRVRACENWALALALFDEIGMAPEVEKTQGRMDAAGCGADGAADPDRVH